MSVKLYLNNRFLVLCVNTFHNYCISAKIMKIDDKRRMYCPKKNCLQYIRDSISIEFNKNYKKIYKKAIHSNKVYMPKPGEILVGYKKMTLQVWYLFLL